MEHSMKSGEQLQRVRSICTGLPGTVEKLSHGEPTFFVGKRVYAMFANNHHNDGHIAVWIPVPPGAQAMGWVGLELAQVDDEELAHHLREAWRLIAPKKVRGQE